MSYSFSTAACTYKNVICRNQSISLSERLGTWLTVSWKPVSSYTNWTGLSHTIRFWMPTTVYLYCGRFKFFIFFKPVITRNSNYPELTCGKDLALVHLMKQLRARMEMTVHELTHLRNSSQSSFYRRFCHRIYITYRGNFQLRCVIYEGVNQS